jgi:hypothetical protein
MDKGGIKVLEFDFFLKDFEITFKQRQRRKKQPKRKQHS